MTSAGPGHRAPLLWLLLPLMAGLAAGRLVTIPTGGALGAAGLLLVAAGLAMRRRRGPFVRWWATALVAAVMLAGAVFLQWRRHRLADWERLPPREASLELRVTRVFASSVAGARMNGLGVVTDAAPHLRDLRNQRLFFSCRLPVGRAPPRPTSRIVVRGVLERVPLHPPAGSFTAFLADTGLNFELTRGRLLAVTQPPSPHERFRQAAAARLHAILGQGLERRPVLTGILRAMMLGRTGEMTGEQRELFMHSGALHLFAISGLHIGAIAVSLQSLLLLLRVPRAAAAVLGLTALGLYVDVTGASPSAVRAYVMCSLVIAAFTFHRPGNGLSALAASALIVLLVDPFQLFGASFQMSYGIVAALLLLGVPLARTLQGRFAPFSALPESSWRWYHRGFAWFWRGFLGLLGIGLAATTVSSLTSVQFFQLLTPCALVGNLVLIPLATLVIAAGLVSLLCGLAGWAGGSVIFNHAAAVLLWSMDGFLREATALGGASFPARFRAPWLGPAGHVLLLAVCLAGAAWRWRRARGGFWSPFAIVVLLLTTTVTYG